MTDPIELIASKFANKLKVWNPQITAHTEDIRFGAAYYINYYSVIIISLCIGLITGQFLNTGLSLISLGLLRKYTGGFHFKSLTVCVLITVGIVSVIPHISINLVSLQVLNIISLSIVCFSRSIGSKEKMISLMIIMTNIIFASPVIALSFFVQAIQLINLRRCKLWNQQSLPWSRINAKLNR